MSAGHDLAATVPRPESLVGHQIGNYRVLSRLGEGGMGFVYLAQHTVIRRKVAIKVLRPELAANQLVVKRFFNEAKATASLDHPGLAELLDVGYHPQGWAYIIMEYFEGESLGQRLIGGRRMPVRIAIQIASELASTLAVVHRAGIIHRDLKPENIFLANDASKPHGFSVKIIDFGIAKLYESQTTETKGTQADTILGSPPYMSPEQCNNATHVDARADIYSMACVLFEMLTGDPPFMSNGRAQILIDHLTKAPPRLGEKNPNVPQALDELANQMLAKRPEERIQNMDAIVATLSTIEAPEIDSEIPYERPSFVYAPSVTQDQPPDPLGETAIPAFVVAPTSNGQPGTVTKFGQVRLKGNRGMWIGLLILAGAVATVAIVMPRSGHQAPAPAAVIDAASRVTAPAAPTRAAGTPTEPVSPAVLAEREAAERARMRNMIKELAAEEKSTTAKKSLPKVRRRAGSKAGKTSTRTAPDRHGVKEGVLDPFAE